MADITPSVPEGRQLIQSYGDGGFRIAGVVRRGSVIVFPDRTIAWSAASIADATRESLGPVIAAGSDVNLLLIGSGRAQGTLDPAVRKTLRDAGIVAEVMDTGAACRTFNVLLSEERRVAAALIAIP